MKIRLENLTKIFKDKEGRETIAVDKLNVDIEDGKLIGLLGPSGCGKSTTLYMIAGLHDPTSGHIYFDDDDVTRLGADKRGIGLVFQNYALYPHLTILENILFPLQNLKMKKEEALERANKMAELVGISTQLGKKPSQLSGGQQQRVAIARALVKEPKVLLLDEPLSNLDARLRLQMREEIKRIQRETGITTIFVTHDQEEAMSICDQIVLMEYGVEQQRGKPQDIYDDPKNLFVAKFLGTPPINLFNATVKGGYINVGDQKLLTCKNLRSTFKTWDEIKEGYPVIFEDNSDVLVKVTGSKKYRHKLQVLLQRFSQLAGNFKYELRLNGSEDAFDSVQGRFRDKKKIKADIGITSRKLREDERGVARFITPFLVDTPVIVVNNENPHNDFSYDNVKKILQGKVKYWEFIESENKVDKLIKLFLATSKSGSRNHLLDRLGLFRGGKFMLSKKHTPCLTALDIVKSVSENKQGLGVIYYTDFMALKEFFPNVKMATIDQQEITVEKIRDLKTNFSSNGVIICRSNPKQKSELLGVAFSAYLKTNDAVEVLTDRSDIILSDEFKSMFPEYESLLQSQKTVKPEVRKVVSDLGETEYSKTFENNFFENVQITSLEQDITPTTEEITEDVVKVNNSMPISYNTNNEETDIYEPLRHIVNIIEPKKEYILGIRPEGYVIDKNGKFKLSYDYYESVGRDISILCKNFKSVNPSFRIITSDMKGLKEFEDKDYITFNIVKGKYYLFEKETGERVL